MRVLRDDISGLQARKWNAERFIFFQTVILQYTHHVVDARAIIQRLRKRLDMWEAGQHQMLFKETSCTFKQYLSASRWYKL